MLLDEDGRADRHRADKATVHHRDTPLHLAFSCYVFDADGRLLVTQRALAQADLRPGVWTNSCCGHPAPGEPIARRRTPPGAARSSGSAWPTLRLLLPRFRYRAVMDDGTVENEMCPVFVATHRRPRRGPTRPRSRTSAWVPWAAFRDERARRQPRRSARGAASRSRELPADPLGAAEAAYDGLPPAARG